MKKQNSIGGYMNGTTTGSNFSQQGNQKLLTREKIKQIDESFQNLDIKVDLFEDKVKDFNF